MEANPMPEPLRRAVHQQVAETVRNCQEVLRYTEPDQAHTWQRMTLIRGTDAADTMNMMSLLIAAYCQKTGMPQATLATYLQSGYQHSRAAGPTEAERAQLAGLLGEEIPSQTEEQGLVHSRYRRGQITAEDVQEWEDDPQKLFTEAVLHGLSARLCDDVDALDSYLPPHVAQLARKVAGVLEVPQPATA
jgi:hypothetical protein